MVNLVAGLICYTHQPKKPTLRIPEKERQECNLLVLTCNAYETQVNSIYIVH